jgi:all-trans-retinol dehydrogenase (NAD+)
MLPPRFQEPANYLLLPTALKSLLGIGIVRKAQNWLSHEVLNNFASDNTWDWPQEIVVMTGGCSGIGDHTVRQFAKRCVKVVVVDVVPPKKPFPANAFFYALDVTSSVDIHAVAGKIRKEVGEPTVLVNNAGIRTCKAILEETEEQIRRTFDVNIIAHFLLVREFLPYRIRRNHGHIVTIASLASFLVHARNVDYTCTKAAALAFHEGLSAELKNHYEAPKVRTT